MSVSGLIAAYAANVGAELVGKVMSGVFGAEGGALAEFVVTSVADKLGVPSNKIAYQPQEKIEKAVMAVEADMPEKIALWAKGLDHQFDLLQTEAKQGFWQSAWRWGWMYLLGVFWFWTIMLVPILAAFGIAVERIDIAVLLTLTTWFISLYMGGHTVKELGASVGSAMRSIAERRK